ncbi:MAG: site-specific integrase [Candidatus Bathyarchaeia archaeon]
MKKPEYERGFWRRFLRLSPDGNSSGFESVDLLLEHLQRMTKSSSSKKQYCYSLWVACLWVTRQLKLLKEEKQEQAKKQCKTKIRWSKLAEELNFDIINPDQLVSLAKENPEKIERLIRKLALEYYEPELGAFRYANYIIATVNTFFEVNKVDLKIDCLSTRGCSRLRKRQEYIPTLAEALKMASVAGSLRNQLLILIPTYSGLRNSAVRALVYNEDYPDPLFKGYTIKKQLERGEKCLMLVSHPVAKKRDPNACKNNVPYYTFIPPVVTEKLWLYINELEREHGPLRDDQPIFHTENRRLPPAQRIMTPISAREYQKIVKDAARRAGIKDWMHVTPHSLRKTFDSFLRNQPEDVKLDIKEREFLFGHLLPGVQDVYFDKSKIQEMREKYARLNFEPFIHVEKEQRVVSEDELQSFLQQGWHFEAVLRSGKVVIWRKVAEKRSFEDATTPPILENIMQDQRKMVPNANLNQTESRNVNTKKELGKTDKAFSALDQKGGYLEQNENLTETKQTKILDYF